MDKKTGEILGLIIGIVGLLVALAALAVAIPGHAGPSAVAIFGGGIGVAGGYWLYRRARAVPPFSIQSIKSTFQITRPDGSQCRCSKEVKFRCNYGGQNHFPHRNIYADGEVGDFSWEGDGFLQGQPRKIAGEYCVDIAYDPSWPINRECQGTLSYSVQNTFTGNPEWVGYVCDRPGTESATMEIQLPKERACIRTWACEKSLAGEVRQLNKPEVKDQGTRITLTISNPKAGSEYHVYWQW